MSTAAEFTKCQSVIRACIKDKIWFPTFSMKLKADVFLDEKLIYYLHMIVHMFNVLCAI